MKRTSTTGSNTAITDTETSTESAAMACADSSTPDPPRRASTYSRDVRSVVKVVNPNLRALLTFEQQGRDPSKYYEKIQMLGVGSMGSVVKVKKKREKIGGSARDENRRKSFGKIPLLGKIIRSISVSKKGSSFIIHHEVSDMESEHSNARHNNSGTVSRRSSRRRSSHLSMASDRNYEVYYALKSLNLDRVKDDSFEVELRNEVEILKKLDHPYIVKVIEAFDYKRHMYMVLELCSGGDLYTRDPYTEEQAARIVRMILSAVKYMHDVNITHRDLKYENVMFAGDRPDSEIKIVDFGLSKKYGNGEIMHDGVGTVYSMAPEVLRGQGYDERADLWSVGVITYMLLSSRMPFYGSRRAEVISKIMKGEYDFKGRRMKNASQQSKDLVAELLQVDPKERPTAAEARRSLWLHKSVAVSMVSPELQKNMRVITSIEKYANYSVLQKLALMVIAHKSTSEEIGFLRKMFQQFSKGYDEKSGAITKTQFEKVMGSYGYYSEEDIDDIFCKLDIDGSGFLQYTEFLAATLEAHGLISEERLAEGFDRLDSDNSGYITAENLRSFLGDGLPDSVIEKIITDADLDGNRKISYDEFLALWEGSENEQQDESCVENVLPVKSEAWSPDTIFGGKQGEGSDKGVVWDAANKWDARNAWEDVGMM